MKLKIDKDGKPNVHDLKVAQIKANKLFGPVTWISDLEGFCTCPGQHLHTTTGTAKDCMIVLEKHPRLFCVHQACRDVVREAGKKLHQRFVNQRTNAPFNKRNNHE